MIVEKRKILLSSLFLSRIASGIGQPNTPLQAVDVLDLQRMFLPKLLHHIILVGSQRMISTKPALAICPVINSLPGQ